MLKRWSEHMNQERKPRVQTRRPGMQSAPCNLRQTTYCSAAASLLTSQQKRVVHRSFRLSCGPHAIEKCDSAGQEAARQTPVDLDWISKWIDSMRMHPDARPCLFSLRRAVRMASIFPKAFGNLRVLIQKFLSLTGVI
jgi:hypothetical protein